MSGGGKSQRQTTNTNSSQTSTSAAPTYAQPYLENIARRAGEVYSRAGDYTGAMSPDTLQSLDMVRRIATGGNPLGQSAYDSSMNTINSGGLSSGQRDVLGNLGNEYTRLSGPGAAESNLSGYATGSMLSGNPYLDKILETTNAGIANRVNGSFGAAGRSFSPSHAAAVAKNIAASDNQARYSDYDQQVQNQFNANQMIDASRNARAGLRSGILGQQFGGEQTGVNNVNTAISNSAALDNARYSGANALNRVGQQVDANQASMAHIPWQNLTNFLNTVRGSAGNYGTTTSTGNSSQETIRPGPSGLQQAIGLGTTIAGLATGNPMMAVSGGAGGGKGGGGKGGGGLAGGGAFNNSNMNSPFYGPLN